MKYPVAIEAGTDTTAWSVVVPDLPGCFSAGDSLDEAYDNAKEAIAVWINAALDDGQIIPVAKTLAEHVVSKDFKGWQWAIVDVDLAQFDDKVERINISIPKRVLRQIDNFVAPTSENRSEFLARAALDVIYHSTKSSERKKNDTWSRR
jgi:predicted RNase H-like HicB family nuclease